MRKNDRDGWVAHEGISRPKLRSIKREREREREREIVEGKGDREV